MSWFAYALLASLILGLAIALSKIHSKDGYNQLVSTLWTNAASAAAVAGCLAALRFGGGLALPPVSGYGLLWGLLFAANMVVTKQLLRHIDLATLVPIGASVGMGLTVLTGVIALGERITWLQGTGLLVVAAATASATGRTGTIRLTWPVVWRLTLGLGSATSLKYVQKLAANVEPAAQFMAWQYLGAVLGVLVVILLFDRSGRRELGRPLRYWRGAAAAGVLSAVGGYFIFRALNLGPMSMVYGVTTVYIFVVMAVGALLFKEHLTRKKITLAVLCAVGIVLLRVG
jgi:drug/metabolite transporter (DMT)-like permease